MRRPTEQQLGIVHYVRQNGVASRSKLCRALDLSHATVTGRVRELIALGLLTERGFEESTGGRRQAQIRLDPQYLYAIGIQVGMRGIRGAVMDFCGKMAEEQQADLPRGARSDDTIDAICNMIGALKGQLEAAKLCGVGIGISGVIREGGRVTRLFPDAEQWMDVPLADVLEERCNVRPLLIKDVQAAALAELRLGGWGDIRNLILLHLGDGIAAGIVTDRKLYLGATLNAGEIGHNIVSEGGPLCYCGNRGCLERVAAPAAIVEACREAAASGVRTRVVEEAGGIEKIAFKHITRAAETHDRLACNLLNEAGRHIGQSVASLINVFDPQLFLLGGLLVEPGGELVESIERTARSRVLPTLRNAAYVKFSRLKDSAATLGAGVMVLDKLFDRPEKLLGVKAER